MNVFAPSRMAANTASVYVISAFMSTISSVPQVPDVLISFYCDVRLAFIYSGTRFMGGETRC